MSITATKSISTGSSMTSELSARWQLPVQRREEAVERLIDVLERSAPSPVALGAFALRQVAGAAIMGSLDPAAGHLPMVVDAFDVLRIRRILCACGGPQHRAVSREEADILMEINDQTVEEMNHPSWSDLFVRAMTSFVLGADGGEVPERTDALSADMYFASGDADPARLMERLVPALRAILPSTGQPAACGPVKQGATSAGGPSVAWLALRLTEGRLLRDNERALLGTIGALSREVPEPLRPLVARVA